MSQCKRYALECKRGCITKCACENSYHPSNGTEGMSFIEEYCAGCIHDNPDQNASKPRCDILTATMCFYPTDPEYPVEWIVDSLGAPKCTKFVPWDWGNDGDPNDPDNPKAPPPPPDPRQLNLFPMFPAEHHIVVEMEKVTA